jgi:preprotein translocase subunit SecA
MVEESCPENRQPEDWDWQGLHQGFKEHFQGKLDPSLDDLGDADVVVRRLYDEAQKIYEKREKELGTEISLRVFRHLYVEAIDEAWVEHLSNMEHLRDGIGLRGYGQRDPKNEYKKEGYNLFLNMMAKISSNVIVRFFEAEVRRQEDVAAMEHEAELRHQAELDAAIARHPNAQPEDQSATLNQMREAAAAPLPARRPAQAGPKIGRNDPCPCGSGTKFKQCHGAILEEDEPSEEPQPRA